MESPGAGSRGRGAARARDVATLTAAVLLLLPACLGFVVATTALLAPLVPGGEPALVAPPLAAGLAVTSLVVVGLCWCRAARSLAAAVEPVMGRPRVEPVSVPAPRSGAVSVPARPAARR